MCGLCGIVDFTEGAGPSARIVHEMLDTIRHRGPDDSGIFAEGPAVLGHARLSIIDLTCAGHQPMTDASFRTTLVFNGEVYNFRELRAELAALGVIFNGHSDTEVVLQAYNRWGLGAFRRFEGMFSLAIWDRHREQLVLARDRFGIKPLYYSQLPNGIVFGSEIKSLLASRRIDREMAPGGLHEYMWYGNALGENTFFRGVRKLPPASVMVRMKSGTSVFQYWTLEQVPRHSPGIARSAEEVSKLLERAVQSHLVADVPLGVFLSGGIDSSAIAAFASRHYGGPLETFSASFDFSSSESELPMAQRLATDLRTSHHELHIKGMDLPETIEALVRCHDQPFADSANIPLYLMSRELGGKPKVILQGDGGDEIFGGYRRHNVFSAEWLWRLAAPAGRAALSLGRRSSRFQQSLRFLEAMSEVGSARRMALLLTQDTHADSPVSILAPRLQREIASTDPFVSYRELARRFKHESPLQRMLYTDTSIVLPDTFLEKVDKSTMAFGIEVRVPFLDNRLTDYVLGLPGTHKVRAGRKKYLLRRALRGIVPDYVLDAPKRGFAVPFENWLRGPLAPYMKSVLFNDDTRRAELFREDVLREKIAAHTEGRRNYGFLLWKALNLTLWHREYIAGAA